VRTAPKKVILNRSSPRTSSMIDYAVAVGLVKS
jgi:hypothetical protein